VQPALGDPAWAEGWAGASPEGLANPCHRVSVVAAGISVLCIWALKEMKIWSVANDAFLRLAFAQILVTGSRALLLKQWNWRESKCVRTWKAVHTAPVASMAFDSTSTLLATGTTVLLQCHAAGAILRGPSAFG